MYIFACISKQSDFTDSAFGYTQRNEGPRQSSRDDVIFRVDDWMKDSHLLSEAVIPLV